MTAQANIDCSAKSVSSHMSHIRDNIYSVTLSQQPHRKILVMRCFKKKENTFLITKDIRYQICFRIFVSLKNNRDFNGKRL